MQRLFAGLLCFFALNLLCGCTGFKDSFSRLEKYPAQQQVETKVSTSAAGTNETTGESDILHKTTAAAAAPAVTLDTIIPESAQTCRLDIGACLPPIPPQVSTSGRADTPVPIVQLPETSYDFGTIGDGTFTHKFSIKNAGASELVIKKIIPG
ncbi:hypothetical protein SBDP1_420020 [Syntrophobacter sp. SbD1]|nr:hypothetical protein SBDP1_420020 [Syntrophobacter sp. SbD1]